MEWHDVKGFEGLYKISRCARLLRINKSGSIYVRSLCGKTPNKYVSISLKDKDGNVTIMGAHRLVAMQFIDNPNNHPVVNHLDENPANNKVENLEWCTHQHNSLYSAKIKKEKERIKYIESTFYTIEHILKINKMSRKSFDVILEACKEAGRPVFITEIEGQLRCHKNTLPDSLIVSKNDTNT